MDQSTLACACALKGIEAGRAIRESVHAMPLGERAQPRRSRLKPEGNVAADAFGEDVGIRHLEALAREVGYRIHLVTEPTREPEVIGASAKPEVVFSYFDAVDGTIKVAGLSDGLPEGRLRAANDGGWATAMAFTAPTRKSIEDLVIGDFVAAAVVDGNPTRYRAYPQEVITIPGATGLETYDLTDGVRERVFTTTNTTLRTAMVYLDGFQAYDGETNQPGDEALAVELYRLLINRHDGGAFDVWRQYANLNALQRMMLGWRADPVWHESQGAAFIAINENLANLIPAVLLITGAGGLSVDFENELLLPRKLTAGRTSVLHAANEVIRARVIEIVRAARQHIGPGP